MSSNSDLIDYSKCALLIWDMQNGITARTLNVDSVVKNIKKLSAACHECKRPVFYSQNTGLPFEFQSPYNKFWLRKRGIDPKIPRMVEGSKDWEIRADIAPESQRDFILKKTTHSFFAGTNLEQLLRGAGICNVIVSGVSTEVGIETTARHAGSLGFVPIIPEDAVGSSEQSLHEASITVMRKLFEIDSADRIASKIISDCKRGDSLEN